MPLYRYAYFHGFGSSHASKKGLALRASYAKRGVDLWLPDLNRPSFAKLSHGAMLAYLERVDEEGRDDGPWRIIGSSLGGWLAAWFAERRPKSVDALVLLCPGFGLAKRWPALVGEAGMAQWESQGELSMQDGAGEQVPVHYQFYREACEVPAVPKVSCPTLIVHGSRDEVVPVEHSRRYVGPREHLRLIEVDDDHSLMQSVERIDLESWRHFERL